MKHQLRLQLLPHRLSVCRLSSDAAVPQWASRGGMLSVTRTDDELSIVCESKYVPGTLKSEKGWRCFKLEGPFPFAMTGVLASVLDPLAKAGVSIFALSTYDTDYVMVKEKAVVHAMKALRAAGHHISAD